MLAHVALPSCQTEGGYWAGERGLLSTAQVQCGKNGGFDVFFSLVISIYIYCYSLIYLYRYCAICLLLYCMLAAWWYYFLYIYILFLSLTSTFFSPNVRTTQTGIKFYNSFHCSVIHVALML